MVISNKENSQLISQNLNRLHDTITYSSDDITLLPNLLQTAVLNSNIKVVESLLLNHQADPNTTRKDGLSILFIAAQNGYLGIAELLLKHGANPNASNKDGLTALFIAAQHGYLDIIKALLENPETQTDTPFFSSQESLKEFAENRGEIVMRRINEFIEHKIASGVDSRSIPMLPTEIASIMGYDDIANIIKNRALIIRSKQHTLFGEKRSDDSNSVQEETTDKKLFEKFLPRH